jgi:hypothetical protein
MSDLTKRVFKTLGFGVIWVFVLSIRVDGHTLFYYANDLLVQNGIVEAIDHTLAQTYDEVSLKIKTTFAAVTGQGKSL